MGMWNGIQLQAQCCLLMASLWFSCWYVSWLHKSVQFMLNLAFTCCIDVGRRNRLAAYIFFLDIPEVFHSTMVFSSTNIIYFVT